MQQLNKKWVTQCRNILCSHLNTEGLLSVCRNTSALFFMRIFSYLVPFLVLPYLSRILGVTGFGSYAIAISVCSLILMITDYGFYLSGAHWIAKNQQNKAKVAEYLASIVLIKGLLIAICFSILLAVVIFMPFAVVLRGSLLPIMLLVISQSFYAEWIFQGIEKIMLAIYPFLLGRLLFLLMVFSLVHTEQDTHLVIHLLSLSNLLTLLMSCYLLYNRGFYLKKPVASQICWLIKYNIMFFLSRLAAGIYSNASTFIIGFTNGAQAAGIYSAAEKLYLAGQSMASPLSQALYPYLARTGDKKLFYIMLFIFALPLTFFCLLLRNWSQEIIIFIYGNDFAGSAAILNIFLLCTIVNFISGNFNYPAFSAINKLSIANITVLAGGGLQFILILLLLVTDKLSGLSVALSILFAELLLMWLRMALFFYLIRRRS